MRYEEKWTKVGCSMMQLLVDTNILLRFLTQEPEGQAFEVNNLMSKVEKGQIRLVIHPMVLAECSYVLKGRYFGLTNHEIGSMLTDLIMSKGIGCIEETIIQRALTIFSEKNVDFEDAYLAAYTVYNESVQLITYDQDFQKIDIEYYSPMEIIQTLDDSD